MTKRLPGSERTREALNDLMDGRLQIMAGSRQDDVVFDILRQPNFCCWLYPDLPGMSEVGPLYPQLPTFWARLGRSEGDPLRTWGRF